MMMTDGKWIGSVTGDVHCEHGQCTCWKVELVVAQGTRLLYCNTYTPVYHKSDRLLVDDPLEGWY